MSVLRWGIISAGKVANDFVAALSDANHGGHKIAALAASDVNRARELAKKFGIPKVYATYDELISSQEVDVVYVGVINPLHYEITSQALEKGKPVLCEKPMAMNIDEALELVILAEKKRVFLMEAIWSRCFPLYDTVYNSLKENTIGQIRQVNVTLGLKNSHIPRISQKNLGGSCVLDLGGYALQLVVLVFGRKFPEVIDVHGTLNNEGIDEYVTCLLKFGENKYAQVTISSTFQMDNNAYIYGTEGIITMCNPFWKPTKILINDRIIEQELPPSDHEFYVPQSSALLYEADHVKSCLQKGHLQSPLLMHADSLAIAKLQEVLRRKIRAYVP